MMIRLSALGVGIAAISLALAGMTGTAAAQTGVWHQAFERPSADAPCEPPEDETPWQESFTGQRDWTPSWAQWANDGQGGWVCQRYIVWAQTQTFPSAGCIKIQETGGPFYSNFGGGYALPVGSTGFSDADCSVDSGSYTVVPVVFAPSGFNPDALCREAFGIPVDIASDVPDIYTCNIFI